MPESRIVERRIVHVYDEDLRAFVPSIDETILWSGNDYPTRGDVAAAKEAVKANAGRLVWRSSTGEFDSGEGELGTSEMVVQEHRVLNLGRFSIGFGWREATPPALAEPEVATSS